MSQLVRYRSLKSTFLTTWLCVAFAAASVTMAATPPPLMNYQGVLRDVNGVPITGTRDMTFRFFDDPNAGSEILIDAHTGGAAVMIDGGLFSVTLGGGAVSDGSSAGSYSDLASVFLDFGQVWLEINVAGETLTPRVQVLSAAYSLNASSLNGKPAGSFLDTSATTQAKSGDLIVDDLAVGGSGPEPGRVVSLSDTLQLNSFGGSFTFGSSFGPTAISLGPTGSIAMGSRVWLGGNQTAPTNEIMFQPSGSLGAWFGIQATASDVTLKGGFPSTSDLKLLAADLPDDGSLTLEGNGPVTISPGNGILSIENAGVETARLDGGGDLQVDGNVQIGWPPDQGGTALSFSNGAHVAVETGITRFFGGDAAGAILHLQSGSGSSSWISMDGTPTGGFNSGLVMSSADGTYNFNGTISPFGSVKLTNPTSSSLIQMQPGGMTLVAGSGDTYDMTLIAGNDTTDGGISILGDSDVTFTAGNGLFNFVAGSTGSNIVQIASNGDLQIDGSLTACCNSASSATLASASRGILAKGSFGLGDTGEAGRFCDLSFTGEAELADGNSGVVGFGSFAGGIFRHRTTNSINCTATAFDNEVRLATATSGIETSAAKNFVQNHPYDPTKLVVYTSLEGDEVGTYTRGVGRLQGGVARVPLGETFAWVTNPGLGLTAHVTPRGEWNDLYVESVTTKELVVRSRNGAAEGAFDYIVHGLRVGFEEASVVRERDVDAYIPSMTPHEELYTREPALRSLNAGERFKSMQQIAGEPVDLDAGRTLAAAIGVHEPSVHGAPRNQLLGGPIANVPVAGSEPGTDAARPAQQPAPVADATPSTTLPSAGVPEPSESRARAADPCRGVAGCALFLVDEMIETGELLALDRIRAGDLALAAKPADPDVVGVALGNTVDVEGHRLVPVISIGFAELRVDASYGSIRAGDLLSASPTPGHAMRSEDPLPGTIVGKALESLEAGTALIRVLVMMR